MSLTHMLPDSSHYFEDGCGGRCDYEFAFLIALLGYALILFIERVIVNPYRFYGHGHGPRDSVLQNP